MILTTESVMVCYYGSWAVYRQGDGKFDVEDIDPGLCSHLIFGFAGLGTDNKIRVRFYQQFHEENYKNPEFL